MIRWVKVCSKNRKTNNFFFLGLVIILLVAVYSNITDLLSEELQEDLSLWRQASYQSEHVPICSNSQRQDFLQDMCANTALERSNWTEDVSAHSRFIYDRKNRIMYCEVSKAACTTWKAIITDLALNDTSKQRMDAKGIHSAELYLRTNISITGSWLPEFENYTKILTVRHPLDRVISAFYNLKYFQPSSGMHGPGGDVRSAIKQLFGIKLRELNFQKFSKFITRQDLSGRLYYDRHFDSFVKTCRVCDIKYDYIMRTETMQHDITPLLQKLRFSEEYINSLKISDKTRPNNAENFYYYTIKSLPEFDRVHDDSLELLVDRYRYDMSLFGYSVDKSGVAKCEANIHGNKCC